MALRSLTIIIPTYNEEKNISTCLKSIFSQYYPKDKLQVIVIDGDSTDRTREIAKEMGAQVIGTHLPNEEMKKALAIKKYAKGEIIGLIDADNVIPSGDKMWIEKMVQPFDDPQIYATDTLYYSSRKNDSLVVKYGEIIGGDDPIASYLGINDRYCYFTGKWTGAPHTEEDKGDYIKVKIEGDNIPAIGSNGFFFRKKLYALIPNNNAFVHPLVIYELSKKGYTTMAKVKQGIIHAQVGGISNFFKKKVRRMSRRSSGEIKWSYNYGLDRKDMIKVALYISTIVLPVKDSLVGFIKKPSRAWLFHPFACVILLLMYGFYFMKGIKI